MATPGFKITGRRASLAVLLPVPLWPTSQAEKRAKVRFMGPLLGPLLASFRALPVATNLTSAPLGRVTSTSKATRARRLGGLFAFRARAALQKRG